MSKIVIGSDHKGYRLKEQIKEHLRDKDYEIEDVGTFSEESCDYPDFILRFSQIFGKKGFKRGIFICMTGIGSSIALNKYRGIRAALVLNEDMARFSRLHNDSNVLVLGAKYTSLNKTLKILKIWLNTGFAGGRHRRRIKKIGNIEKLVNRC